MCTPYSNCNDNTQFISVYPTCYQDRVCSALQTCDASTQYESNYGARAEDEDRQCASFTQCDTTAQFASVAAVTYGSRATGPRCSAFRVCDTSPVSTGWGDGCQASRDKEYETTASSPTSNRVCRRTTRCGEHEYMTAAWTPMSDVVCTPHTVCPSHMTAGVLATPCLDRTCVTHSPTAYPTAIPTATPTATPTASPTAFPTAAPTLAPTEAPTERLQGDASGVVMPTSGDYVSMLWENGAPEASVDSSAWGAREPAQPLLPANVKLVTTNLFRCRTNTDTTCGFPAETSTPQWALNVQNTADDRGGIHGNDLEIFGDNGAVFPIYRVVRKSWASNYFIINPVSSWELYNASKLDEARALFPVGTTLGIRTRCTNGWNSQGNCAVLPSQPHDGLAFETGCESLAPFPAPHPAAAPTHNLFRNNTLP